MDLNIQPDAVTIDFEEPRGPRCAASILAFLEHGDPANSENVADQVDLYRFFVRAEDRLGRYRVAPSDHRNAALSVWGLFGHLDLRDTVLSARSGKLGSMWALQVQQGHRLRYRKPLGA